MSRYEEEVFGIQDMIDYIVDNAPVHWDWSFYESLHRHFQKKGVLTDKQYQALSNGYEECVNLNALEEALSKND